MSNNIITPEIETEAAIYAEGTRFTKENIIKGYRVHVEVCGENALDIQRFCEQILKIENILKIETKLIPSDHAN